MTIICYRDGKMAGDTAIWDDNAAVGHARKVIRTTTGYLVGGTSHMACLQRVHQHVETCTLIGSSLDTFDARNDEHFSAIIVEPDGTVNWLSHDGLVTGAVGEYFAEGIGQDVALGAMAAGATAEEAVRICFKHVSKTGGSVDVVSLDEGLAMRIAA